MASDIPILIAALVAIPLGPVWSEWHARLAERRERQERCDHRWGDPVEVAKAPYGTRVQFFKQFCQAGCGKQRDCHADGSEHVPGDGCF